MNNFTEEYTMLSQVVKEMQQPTVTLIKAKDLYTKGTELAEFLLKDIEGLKRDADSYTIE